MPLKLTVDVTDDKLMKNCNVIDPGWNKNIKPVKDMAVAETGTAKVHLDNGLSMRLTMVEFIKYGAKMGGRLQIEAPRVVHPAHKKD